MLLGAVAFVLLIACANVANLLLARGTTRGRELALRRALGAGRGRLVSQLLTESALLALAGGALGLLVAWGVLRVIARIDLAAPSVFVPFTPLTDGAGLDAPVLAFTLAVSLATGILAGLWPALHASTVDPAAGLAEGGRGTSARAGRRVRDALVVAEVALGIRLLRGRDFDARDDERGARVALVSEAMARRDWPGQDPIGKRVALSIEALRFVRDGPPILDLASAYRTVVGVVADVREDGLSSDPEPRIYLPVRQYPARDTSVAIRTRGDPAALAAALRGTVAGIDPAQPVSDVRSMQDVVAGTIGQPRYRTLLLGLFAGVAALLAAIGLYGVLAYAVARRQREIGVRMALGARGGDVVRRIVLEGLRLAGIGIAVGLAGALALTRLLAGFLYGVEATDPVTFLATAAALATVAALAAALPAWRASRVAPTVALRAD